MFLKTVFCLFKKAILEKFQFFYECCIIYHFPTMNRIFSGFAEQSWTGLTETQISSSEEFSKVKASG